MNILSSKELKRIMSLSQKKFRDEYGLFIVEGDKMVEEARRSDFEVVTVYFRDKIGVTAMSRISSLSTPPPSLAIVRQPEDYRKTLDDISKSAETEVSVPSSGLVLGLDSIRDPGNLGTILRTADWFGIKDVYVSYDTVEVFNPKVVQATMGSIFRVKVHYCNLIGVAERIHKAQGLCFGTFLEGEDLFGFDFSAKKHVGPTMIVIGNESNGISIEVAAALDHRISIPRCQKTGNAAASNVSTRNKPVSEGPESLNAATAAAIAIAEYRRQMNR